MKKQLTLKSIQKNYVVDFVENSTQLLNEVSVQKDMIIVVDRNIERLYPELCKSIYSLGPVFVFDATEQNKSLAGAEAILNFFQSVKAIRTTTVIAIGGGILQDITLFAAHIYYRGLDVVLLPTTLLAMCDSCIGGKCSVNFNGYKSQVGAFHPPTRVIIWPEFLKSLPDADLQSGYGEILKYRLLNGAEFYTDFKHELAQHRFGLHSIMEHIYLGLLTKKRVIEEDEFDTGVRRLINFGHTFGHAIEFAVDYAIPHGVAVSQGIDIANYIAWQRGILNQNVFEDVHETIRTYFPCNFAHLVTAETLVTNAEKDKKILDRKLIMVLMEDLGKFRIEPVAMDDALLGMVRNYLSSYQ